MGITDGKLLYWHGVSEGDVDNKISTLEYNNRRVYDWFKNSFTDEFGIPDLHLPPITIDDRPIPHKRAQTTLDMLPDAISFASVNFGSTFTTTNDLPYLLPYDDPNNIHAMNKDVPFQGRVYIE